MKRLLVIPLVLLILRRVDSQNTMTGNALPCGDENLSCASPGVPVCLALSQLCDGNDDCPGGSPDEGFEFASLDCTGVFGPPMMFRCTGGEVVTLDLLCDGINQCTSGEDERSIICENKCRLPYYGGCDFSRECVTTVFGQNCGDCLSGYTQNQLAAVPFTDPCIPAVFLTLDATSYDTSEDDATVQVCVSGSVGTGDLTDIAGLSFEVHLELFPGSAIFGDDYRWSAPPPAVKIHLTFDSTNLLVQQCNDISIIDDDLIEGGEAFSVSLIAQNNTNGQIILQTSSASVSIADNDVATFQLSPTTYTVREDEGNAVVIVECIGGELTFDIEVTFETIAAGSNATAGLDYTATTVTLTFSAGTVSNATQSVNVGIIDDGIVESDEFVNIQISGLSVSTEFAVIAVGGGSGTITIINVDMLECDAPPGIANGVVMFTTLTVGSTATYACNSGFELLGVMVRTCTEIVIGVTAEFLPAEPFCRPPDCDSDPCDENAECTELPGPDNFTCTCIPPFEGDGFTCICPPRIGDDPHFSIMLPTGQLLCYTVQGEHGFAFNLISNDKVQMNAMFLPDSRREEVTWLGSVGITAMNNGYKQSNATSLRFMAKENKVYIGDKVVLRARNIEKLTFSNGKLTISEAPPVEGFKYPSVRVDLQDMALGFTIKFMNEHLDIFWESTGVQTVNSHGLIGQFFRKGIEVDEVRKILIMPNKEPVPVMRRPVWSFMEREMKDDQLCWTAMNPGYQGDGLIDGTYFDYLVNDVLSTDFQFKQQQ